MIHFSISNFGFYNDEVHSVIPDDSIIISNEKYEELLSGQADGMTISLDIDNNPILIESPTIVKTYAELRKAEYPPIEDYLDGVVKGDEEQIKKYIAECLAIKQKYPKTN